MYCNYDPESTAISPRIPAIVNAKHRDNIFVYVLHLNISAMIHRRIELLNPALTSVEVGDFLDVTIQLNPKATDMHKSRHEVTSIYKMDLPPSIKNVYTVNIKENTVAIVQAIVQARENGILANEFIGKITNRFNSVPMEIIRSGQPFIAEVKVLAEGGNRSSFACTKFLGKYEMNQFRDVNLVVKERQGVIWSFTGFHYLVWSPEHGFELVLLPKILNQYSRDNIGQWISFNTLRQVRDSLNIEGEVKLIDPIYPTQNNDNVVEIYPCCIVSGYSNKIAILTIEGTRQRISLKGVEDVNPNLFPRSMWLKPSSDRPFIWECSRKVDLQRKDARPSSSNIENYDLHKGLVLDVYNSVCYVWSNSFSEILICDVKYFDLSKRIVGQWISFNNYSREEDRPKIHHPRLIPDVYPTRYDKNDCVEIEVICDSEEIPDEDGFRVYTSDDIGLIVDSRNVFPDSITLPFTVWVTEESRHRACRWRFACPNNNTVKPIRMLRKLDDLSNQREELASPLSRSLPVQADVQDERSPSVSPPPEIFIEKDRIPPEVPRIREKVDIEQFMATLNAEEGGVYTDDEDDDKLLANNIGEDAKSELSSSSTNLSDEECNVEIHDLSIDEKENKPLISNIQEPPDFSKMTLKEMCSIMLLNDKFCEMFEREDIRLYHAFANKVNE